MAVARGSTAPLCFWNSGCFFSMTCWSISSCARAAVALSHVLALLQVRNAIQRMKDKKKALSFTVSWEESLLPLHPSAAHQRRDPAVPWVCFEEKMMERNLGLFTFVSLLCGLVGQHRPKDSLPLLGSNLLCQGGMAAKAVPMKSIFGVGPGCSEESLQFSLPCTSCLSLQNCSHPTNYLSSPRNTTSWDTGKLRPAAESALPSPVQKDPPVKNITNKGKKIVVAVSPGWVMTPQ